MAFMQIERPFLAMLVAGTVLAASPVALYSNGPINGDSSAYQITGASAFVTDSFTLTSSAVVTTVTFGQWVKTLDSPPMEVEWEIGSSPFGSDLGSGTVPLNAALFCSSGSTCAIGFNVYSSSFSLDVPLGGARFG
jgi:hypothetical protein